MVVQYPHTATLVTPGTNATQDADGNWLPGSEDITTTLKCRAESASNNGYVSTADGVKVDYSWIVYFPTSGNASFTFLSPGFSKILSVLEIIITDGDTGNRVLRSELAGKTFSLERRGVGRLLKSEFTILPEGGFDMANQLDAVQPGEVFIATITQEYPIGEPVTVQGGKVSTIKVGTVITVSGSDGAAGVEIVLKDTVKRFSRGQLNCRVWA